MVSPCEAKEEPPSIHHSLKLADQDMRSIHSFCSTLQENTALQGGRAGTGGAVPFLFLLCGFLPAQKNRNYPTLLFNQSLPAHSLEGPSEHPGQLHLPAVVLYLVIFAWSGGP